MLAHLRCSALISRQANALKAPGPAPSHDERTWPQRSARRVMTNRPTHGLVRSCNNRCTTYLFRMLQRTLPAGCLLTKTASFLASGESWVGASKVISFSLALSCLSCVPWRARWRSPVCGFSPCRPSTLAAFRRAPLITVHLASHFLAGAPRVFSFPFLSHSSLLTRYP
jgi:hypothetical protein